MKTLLNIIFLFSIGLFSSNAIHAQILDSATPSFQNTETLEVLEQAPTIEGIFYTLKVAPAEEDISITQRVPNATIRVFKNGQEVANGTTDEEGFAYMQVPEGEYTITSEHPNYEQIGKYRDHINNDAFFQIHVRRTHYSLDGIVVDHKSFKANSGNYAIPNATVRILDQNGQEIAQTTTDSNGQFQTRVKKGEYEVTAEHANYSQVGADGNPNGRYGTFIDTDVAFQIDMSMNDAVYFGEKEQPYIDNTVQSLEEGNTLKSEKPLYERSEPAKKLNPIDW